MLFAGCPPYRPIAQMAGTLPDGGDLARRFLQRLGTAHLSRVGPLRIMMRLQSQSRGKEIPEPWRGRAYKFRLYSGFPARTMARAFASWASVLAFSFWVMLSAAMSRLSDRRTLPRAHTAWYLRSSKRVSSLMPSLQLFLRVEIRLPQTFGHATLQDRSAVPQVGESGGFAAFIPLNSHCSFSRAVLASLAFRFRVQDQFALGVRSFHLFAIDASFHDASLVRRPRKYGLEKMFPRKTIEFRITANGVSVYSLKSSRAPLLGLIPFQPDR